MKKKLVLKYLLQQKNQFNIIYICEKNRNFSQICMNKLLFNARLNRNNNY